MNKDFDDVRVMLNEHVVDQLETSCDNPNLGFKLGNLQASIPTIFYHESLTGDERVEKICSELGIITMGSPGSTIPYVSSANVGELWTYNVESQDLAPKLDFALYETLNPLSESSKHDLKILSDLGCFKVVSCPGGIKQAKTLANELKLASALVIGTTQSSTYKNVESMGMSVPRVSLLKELSRICDVPLIVTAGSSADVCKAIVAGADAVLISIGGPFESTDDVQFMIETVYNSLKDNLTNLCKLSNSKLYSDLAFRCNLAYVK